ncbi:MAG: PfkB family carbohydrate kinase [Chloroflexota bacterium]
MEPDHSVDVVGLGLCTVDQLFKIPRMPQVGSSIRATHFLQQSGGLVGTALVTLARLGAKTEIIARIGDDDAGNFIRKEFINEGVGVTRLINETNTVSHLATVLVDEADGERTFISRGSTSSPLQPEDIPQAMITSAKALFVDNVDNMTLQAAQWARAAGVWTVLDPKRNFEAMKPILGLIDVPIVPEKFAREWMPGKPLAAATERLRDMGAKIAVVTCGDQGCIASWDKGTFAFPAFPIEVVDTTGAGDAFHGGFVYGLLQEWTIEDIVRFASAVGTLNCRSLGGRTALPNRAEVDDFIAKHQAVFSTKAIHAHR